MSQMIQKIQVIKSIREHFGCGLKEAKELTDEWVADEFILPDIGESDLIGDLSEQQQRAIDFANIITAIVGMPISEYATEESQEAIVALSVAYAVTNKDVVPNKQAEG